MFKVRFVHKMGNAIDDAFASITTRGRVMLPYEILKHFQQNSKTKHLVHCPCVMELVNQNISIIGAVWPLSNYSSSEIYVDPVVFKNMTLEPDALEKLLSSSETLTSKIRLVQCEKNGVLNASYLTLECLNSNEYNIDKICLHDLMVHEQCYIRFNSRKEFLVKSVGCHKDSNKNNHKNKIYRITNETEITILKSEKILDKKIESCSEDERQASKNYLITRAAQELLSILKASCSVNNLNMRYSILIHGPNAVGKTFAVKKCAKLLEMPLICINQITDSVENIVLETIEISLNKKHKDTVFILLDDLHQYQNDMLVVSQWEKLQNALSTLHKCKVIIIGVTSTDSKMSESGRNVVQINPILRGKFQREIAFSLPTLIERSRFCRLELEDIVSLNNIDQLFQKLGEWTIGYNMGTLQQLVQSIRTQIIPTFDSNNNNTASILNLIYNLCQRNASNLSAKLAASYPTNSTLKEEANVWDEIGGLADIKEKLQQSAQWPILYPDSFRRFGLEPPRGILLYGPPGCAKTTLVRTLAKATHSTFLYCNVAQIYSPYVGESEASLRRVFTEARIMSPSIVFLDEIDALVGKRFEHGTPNGNTSGVESRILSTLLNEMDGVEQTNQLLVIAATNRPDMIDSALMRPGRLDHILYVPPPDDISRRSILNIHTKDLPIEDCEQLVEKIASEDDITGDMTGAELEALCREAFMVAMRQHFSKGNCDMLGLNVDLDHFIQARQRVSPILKKYPNMIASYLSFEKHFHQSRK